MSICRKPCATTSRRPCSTIRRCARCVCRPRSRMRIRTANRSVSKFLESRQTEMNAPLEPGALRAETDDATDRVRPVTRREQRDAYENNKLVKRLSRQVGQAIGDFNMIENGDKVM